MNVRYHLARTRRRLCHAWARLRGRPVPDIGLFQKLTPEGAARLRSARPVRTTTVTLGPDGVARDPDGTPVDGIIWDQPSAVDPIGDARIALSLPWSHPESDPVADLLAYGKRIDYVHAHPSGPPDHPVTPSVADLRDGGPHTCTTCGRPIRQVSRPPTCCPVCHGPLILEHVEHTGISGYSERIPTVWRCKTCA